MIPPAPTLTLFPYTTLFRSQLDVKRRSRSSDSPSLYGTKGRADQWQLLTMHPKHCHRAHGNHDRQREQLSMRSEEHTSELQSRGHLVCRLLLEKKKNNSQLE